MGTDTAPVEGRSRPPQRHAVYKRPRSMGIVEESVLRKNGEEMSQTGTLDNVWILIDGERISSFGTMDGCPKDETDEVIDAERGMVLPTFCDSHTHIVFACTREAIERSL